MNCRINLFTSARPLKQCKQPGGILSPPPPRDARYLPACVQWQALLSASQPRPRPSRALIVKRAGQMESCASVPAAASAAEALHQRKQQPDFHALVGRSSTMAASPKESLAQELPGKHPCPSVTECAAAPIPPLAAQDDPDSRPHAAAASFAPALAPSVQPSALITPQPASQPAPQPAHVPVSALTAPPDAAAPPPSPPPDDDFPMDGLPVSFFRELIDANGGEAAFEGLTTSSVKRSIIVPKTQSTKLSLCAQMRLEGDAQVQAATSIYRRGS